MKYQQNEEGKQIKLRNSKTNVR